MKRSFVKSTLRQRQLTCTVPWLKPRTQLLVNKTSWLLLEDEHSKSPHWDIKYPWIMDPASFPNNRSGVEATFLRTERRLKKDSEWLSAYMAQDHETVKWRAAKKLTKEMADDWKRPVRYMSHLVAPNPHSVIIPVCLVWNSSQKFRGVSLNYLPLKGPGAVCIKLLLNALKNGSTL